ncbi:DUF5329 domain-containing protein [Luteolibacter arcticus]|uniref:DUF5329 domain-containing protein n=1 Tax=Luteolibacter arcticus TaxID=1581411 RepID=A0ABT3GLI8_9BACT|nr:DUF5329 domain-containing protein [Luteolibacter arcticus]MCW1924376.1 DUF5329 domain-containing protein [Luteolibacter arcticus]
MTRSRFLLHACLFLAGVPLLNAAELPPEEKAKIEGLISHVAGLKGATFIRNGKDYDAASAAKFLKGKWEAQGKQIRSATEFIEKIGTKSSTTGRAYRIKLADGKETDCGPYLTGLLKKK